MFFERREESDERTEILVKVFFFSSFDDRRFAAVRPLLFFAFHSFSLSLFLSFSLFQTKENTTNSLVISLSST